MLDGFLFLIAAHDTPLSWVFLELARPLLKMFILRANLSEAKRLTIRG